MRLWTVNRPLRYTGLGLFVDTWDADRSGLGRNGGVDDSRAEDTS